jgi:predicted transcriptional regulator
MNGNTSTSFRLPKELLERLQETAKALDLNMAQAIRRAILEWLERNEKDDGND